MRTQSQPKILVSLATYNEAGNIELLIETIRLYARNASILVVDDNSPDGTGKIVDSLSRTDSRIKTIHRPGKMGIGSAMLRAMEFAKTHGFDYLVTMDADFSHHPKYIPALLEGMRERDIMIGSRYVQGGGVENWPFSRRMMSFGVNLLVRSLFGIRARDTSGGFRCYRVQMLERASLEKMESLGYSFLEELLHRCNQVGARIGESPIIFENRRIGTSKVNLSEVARSLSILIRLGFYSLLNGKRPLSRATIASQPQIPPVEQRRAA